MLSKESQANNIIRQVEAGEFNVMAVLGDENRVSSLKCDRPVDFKKSERYLILLLLYLKESLLSQKNLSSKGKKIPS